MTPHAVGIGLRQPHYQQVLEARPALDFIEVHSENFFHAGGAALHVLEHARAHYPVSLHGVGLSLASADALSAAHLDQLVRLVRRIQPALVSEHLCWGGVEGQYFNDLLPFPYTEEALALLVRRVDRVQSALGRELLVENLSAYVQFRDSQMSELEFLAQLASRTGCKLLLDVNNLYVNAVNFGFDARSELARLSPGSVAQIHLAGHSVTEECLIDTHGSPVCDAVWSLYDDALQRFGPVPTLIEWDTDLPALPVLLAEADRARARMAPARPVLEHVS